MSLLGNYSLFKRPKTETDGRRGCHRIVMKVSRGPSRALYRVYRCVNRVEGPPGRTKTTTGLPGARDP